jgi:hypothetical protein
MAPLLGVVGFAMRRKNCECDGMECDLLILRDIINYLFSLGTRRWRERYPEREDLDA